MLPASSECRLCKEERHEGDKWLIRAPCMRTLCVVKVQSVAGSVAEFIARWRR
jgi:hypothetical protein